MSTHYETLEIPDTATEQEIKKAFRKLSFQTHPDKNPDTKAHERFKQINEAYEILGDAERKKHYDSQRQMKSQFGNSTGFPFGNGGINVHHGTNINHVFENIFREHMGGGGIRFNVNGSGGPNIQIFHNGRPVHVNHQPPPVIQHMQLSLDQAYIGGQIQIETKNESPLKFEIPKGVRDNEKIVLKNIGNHSSDNTLRGDIHIIFHIQKHAVFERHDMDLHCKKTISLKEALCGFSFELTHLNGKTLRINNNNQHSIIFPGYKREIPDYGIIQGEKTGSLYIEFDVAFPSELSEEQRNSLSSIL